MMIPSRHSPLGLRIALAGAGSALGAGLRFMLDAGLQWLFSNGSALLVSVMLVNIAGSALIGWLAPLQDRRAAFWKVGVCGGLTTYSVLAWQTVWVTAQNGVLLAGCFIATTIGLSILAAGICYRR